MCMEVAPSAVAQKMKCGLICNFHRCKKYKGENKRGLTIKRIKVHIPI